MCRDSLIHLVSQQLLFFSPITCISAFPPCLPSLIKLSPSPFLCSPLRGYLVAAPSVFRAGVEESVSVTIFNAKAETRVQVQLSAKGQTVAHGHGSVLGEGQFFKLKLRWHSASLLDRKLRDASFISLFSKDAYTYTLTAHYDSIRVYDV